MSKSNDGGPAFPGSISIDSLDGLNHGPPGMSLRDYFAAHATGDDISAYLMVEVGSKVISLPREQAKYAYADAMLAARGT